MPHDINTFEGRAEYIADCYRKHYQQMADFERQKSEWEMQNQLLQIALRQYIDAINAPLEILRLELIHGVSLFPSKRPWWKFW